MQTPSKQLNLLRQQRNKGYWGRLNKYRLNAALKYSGSQILDVGCSTGQYVVTLQNHGYRIIGLDLLYHAEWQILKSNHPFGQGNLLHLPFPDRSFDTILAFEVIEHIEAAHLAVRELYRVTKHNVIISVPNCEEPAAMIKSGLAYRHWVDPSHFQTFTKATLQRLFEANGFKVVACDFVNPIKPALLFLDSCHVPLAMATPLAALLNRLPGIKKYPMTLLAVGKKT